MGCDIHIRTEAYVCIDNKCAWINVDKWMFHEYEQVHGRVDGFSALMAIDIWDGRNYELFSILADVRNEDDIETMGEPRGLPDDVSTVTLSDYENICDYMDCHSCSHWTLAELKAFYASANSHEALKDLIDAIDLRKDDVFRYTDIEDMDEKIRIVFWFDN